MAKILGYDYEIVYRKGSSNVAADSLSRNKSLLVGQIWQLNGSTVVSELLNKVQALYSSDNRLQKLCKEVQQPSSQHPKYVWDGRFLRRKGKIVVGKGKAIRMGLFQHFHASAIRGSFGYPGYKEKNVMSIVLERAD